MTVSVKLYKGTGGSGRLSRGASAVDRRSRGIIGRPVENGGGEGRLASNARVLTPPVLCSSRASGSLNDTQSSPSRALSDTNGGRDYERSSQLRKLDPFPFPSILPLHLLSNYASQ